MEGKYVVAIDPQGNLSPGEYTGICKSTGLHCVSFYNGYTKKFQYPIKMKSIEKNTVRAKMYAIHGKNLNSLIHDFFPTFSESEIFETERYFFKSVSMFIYKELRIHKKSGRVSQSIYTTKSN